MGIQCVTLSASRHTKLVHIGIIFQLNLTCILCHLHLITNAILFFWLPVAVWAPWGREPQSGLNLWSTILHVTVHNIILTPRAREVVLLGNQTHALHLSQVAWQLGFLPCYMFSSLEWLYCCYEVEQLESTYKLQHVLWYNHSTSVSADIQFQQIIQWY